LVGAFRRTGASAYKTIVGTIRKAVLKGNRASGRWIGGFTGFLCISQVGRPQNLIDQYAGTAKQENPAQNQRRRDIPKQRFLPTARNNISHGIR
jgi:hypothetical protein